ncbi:MAG TPA: glycosyltransferase family 1 protein [Lentisphaeria bacterium]|nr:glycosyltransferase family 1 protein [Lentisphaeria bacterium]
MIVGGAQENTLFTLRGHLENGHETVLVTGPTTGPEGKLLEKVPLPELQVHEEPSLIRAIHPAQDLRAYSRLVAYLRENRFDVVHTHSSKAGIIGRAAAWKVGIPVVAHTVHGPPFHRFEKAWKNQIYITAERYAAKRCHRIYTVADAMTQQFQDAKIGQASQYKTVYSGMDLEPYLNGVRDWEGRRALGIPNDSLVVGKVARLFELKGYEYLFEAIPKILAEVPNCYFLIVGDGLLRSQFEKQVREQGITDHVKFTGLVPPSEVPKYTGMMDVLAHLSLREGLPRAVVQGLASGKPAVTFPLDGAPEIVLHEQTGLLCETENSAAVAESIARLLKDDALRETYGQAGRKHAASHWDWRHMVNEIETDYQKQMDLK